MLWQKVFQVARDFGRPEDMVFVNFITGNTKKHKSKERTENIQNRWNARREKRKIARDVSSLGVKKHPKKL